MNRRSFLQTIAAFLGGAIGLRSASQPGDHPGRPVIVRCAVSSHGDSAYLTAGASIKPWDQLVSDGSGLVRPKAEPTECVVAVAETAADKGERFAARIVPPQV